MRHNLRGISSDSASRRLVAVSTCGTATGDGRGCEAAPVLGKALAARGGLWFGRSRPASWHRERLRRPGGGVVRFALIDVPAAESDGHSAYADRVLRPVLHYRIDLADADRAGFEAYERVNRRFARQLAPLLRPDHLVWAEGHELMLLGRELRRLGWRGATGLSLHTPFPVPEIFAALPDHGRIGPALGDFDLIGFQGESDAANFRRYMARFHDSVPRGSGSLAPGRRRPRLGVYPVGIDPAEAADLAATAEAREAMARMTVGLDGAALVLGPGPLDDDAGLPHRLCGIERLLRDNPDLHGRLAFVQVPGPPGAPPAACREVADEVDRLAGCINGTYGDLDWTPVRCLSRPCSREVLAGLCRLSRVGLVTPLREGMGLAAKEFVAAQDPADPGVLVLSKFAGAAAQLGAAVLVNPHDAAEVAGAIRRALAMSLDERRHRWRALLANLRREDAAWWHRSFLDALSEARPVVRPVQPDRDLAAV